MMEPKPQPSPTALVLDVETTGLPNGTPHDPVNGPIYTCLAKYATARIVAISWVVLRGADHNYEEVTREYHVVNSGVPIPDVVQRIHGISTEHATAHGVSFQDVVVPRLRSACQHLQATTFIAHNLSFDKNVLLSELYRRGAHDLLNTVEALQEHCTMRIARQLLKLPKNPKLSDLYLRFFNREMPKAHHALHDTVHCAQVYVHLQQLQQQSQQQLQTSDFNNNDTCSESKGGGDGQAKRRRSTRSRSQSPRAVAMLQIDMDVE